MADNVTANAGAGGATFATDEIGGIHYPISKAAFGALDAATLVTSSVGLPVGDAGGSLTVDGPLTDTELRATPVPVSLTSTTITGTVAVTQSGVWDEVGINDSGNSITVDAVNLDIRDLTFAADKVDVSGSTAVGVTGPLTDAQLRATPVPISGTVTVTDGAGALNVIVDSGTLTAVTTITNPVAVTQSGTWDEVGINDSGNSITVDAAAGGIIIGDGTNPVVVVTDGADNLANTNNELVTAALAYAFDGTNWDRVTNGGGTEATALRVTIASDSTGVLSIDDNGASLTVDGTVTAAGGAAHDAPVSGNPNLIAGRASAAAPADVSADGDATDIWTLRNGAQAVVLTAAGALVGGDAANGIDVDVTRLPASTNTLEVVGDVAHDVAAAGNPVLVCGIAQDMDDTAPPNQVSAESDATRIATDRDGAVFVRPFGPRIWSYHEDSSSALTDASVHAAPASGLSLYVTDIVVSTGAATALNVFFEEGASKVLGPYYLEAIAGRGLALHFCTPKKITAATALTITTSAAIAHSIDVTGFTAAG